MFLRNMTAGTRDCFSQRSFIPYKRFSTEHVSSLAGQNIGEVSRKLASGRAITLMFYQQTSSINVISSDGQERNRCEPYSRYR